MSYKYNPKTKGSGIICCIMGWYKERGKTGSAMLFYGDYKPSVLTLEDAERCIRWHENGRIPE